MEDIKAIPFDSGKVLNGPASGHWFITPNFWKYVNKDKFDSIDKDKINMAFREAGNKIDEYNFITSLDEEYQCFIEFYEIFSSRLLELELSKSEVTCLAKDLVFNTEKYVFYEDVFEELPKLREKYKLAVVSDAWPSIFDVYEKNDLRKYFDSFIVSSVLGVCKPHRMMYEAALDELDVKPEEAIFIDDSLKNCLGAMELGIKAYLLCRDYEDYLWCKENYKDEGVEIIHSLGEINL
ncbi:MAG: HAD-IA family hydrolase [Lachnospiraceae bacterium]|nr:HAD-IA family hydrolase [Lachnospiraceae bacterium]